MFTPHLGETVNVTDRNKYPLLQNKLNLSLNCPWIQKWYKHVRAWSYRETIRSHIFVLTAGWKIIIFCVCEQINWRGGDIVHCCSDFQCNLHFVLQINSPRTFRENLKGCFGRLFIYFVWVMFYQSIW